MTWSESPNDATDELDWLSVMYFASLIIASIFAAAAGPLDWHSIITEFGFPTALVAFFVWHNFKREQRVDERMALMQDFQQDKLLTMEARGVQTIADNTQALKSLSNAIGRLPCIYRESERGPNVQQISGVTSTGTAQPQGSGD